MSGAGETENPRDTQAGEYVLGLLDAAAARDVERRAAADSRLAAEIAAWRTRLDPLTDLPPPAAPSDLLWHRIEADLPGGVPANVAPGGAPANVAPGGAPANVAPGGAPANAARRNVWRPLALASLAVAAGLAFFIWRGLPMAAPSPWAHAVALLAPPGGVQAALRVQALSDGTLTIVPLRKLALPDDGRLGFWAWPKTEKAPVLLGMLPPEGGQMRYPYPLQDGTPVMVTSEPASGPVATPGPTLFIGLLAVTS